MPAKKEKTKKVKRCVEMFTDEVSIVTKGANGHSRFLMVKSDGDIGQISEDLEKAVPAKDADSETKEKAQQARSKKYGIEILSSGSALTYPANAPTTERLFADPTNLKYPLAYEGDTKPDEARTRNAIARFKQNYETYTKKTSRARVYERIVRAAMSAGIDVSYDPQDPVDSLLPSDLKTRLQKDDSEPESTEPTAADDGKVSLDWLNKVEQSLEKSGDNWLDSAAKAVESVGDKSGDTGKSDAQNTTSPKKESVQKSDDNGNTNELETVRKEADTAKAESAKKDAEIAKLKKDITKLGADLARLQTSIGPPRSQKPGERHVYDDVASEDDFDASFDLSPPLS